MSLSPDYDLILRGATVIDGTSPDSPAVCADIAVKDGAIAAIGSLASATAGIEYSAAGKIAAPGFIDIHTHSDISLPVHPEQRSSLSMGVTTQIVGNCGLSMGLAQDTDLFAFERRWLAPHRARITWDSFDAFLTQTEQRGTGNNIIPLIGHGTLRKRYVGLEDRPADAAEMAAMQAEIERDMECGAWGLSSGLEYPPSGYADVHELTELCRAAGKYGGLYATHLRNEADTLVESVQEALDVAEGAGVPLQLSHHKAEGRANWGKIHTTLKMVDAARSRGMDVQTDQYPYTAFMTSLAVQTLPRWAMVGTPEDVSARLKDPVTRARIRAEVLAADPARAGNGPDSPWAAIQIGVSRDRPEIQGKTISHLAAEAGQEPVDYLLDLLTVPVYLSAVNFAICEPDIAEILRYPWTSICSDGSGTSPEGTTGKDQVHPRTYGTFTRVLARYVRDLGVLSLTEAIYKMTGLPAARLGLTNRGILVPGAAADITLFDANAITDEATFDTPHRYSSGIDAVLVNGSFALKNGVLTGGLNGRVLRHEVPHA